MLPSWGSASSASSSIQRVWQSAEYPTTHGRILDLRGLLATAREQAEGSIQGSHFTVAFLPYDQLATRYPYQMVLPQARLEQILERRLLDLGGDLRRGWSLNGIEQHENSIAVRRHSRRAMWSHAMAGIAAFASCSVSPSPVQNRPNTSRWPTYGSVLAQSSCRRSRRSLGRRDRCAACGAQTPMARARICSHTARSVNSACFTTTNGQHVTT